METETLKRCPLCGTELQVNNDPTTTNELFEEMQELKDQGILNETIFVAVRIVKSMNNNNPAWVEDVVEEKSRDIKDDVEKKLIQEIRPVLQAIMELKGSPQTLGKMQEEALAKRISALKTGQDIMKTEKSLKSGEDIECIIIENGREAGKIVIESKRTKKWCEDHVEQIKRYMDKENTRFGILATTAMPSDALSHLMWRNGVLIVHMEYIEIAYLFMREHLILKRKLEDEYNSKIKQLEVSDQILQSIEEAVNNGELNQIISKISEQTTAIDNAVAKLESRMQVTFGIIRKRTGTTRELAISLMTDHIEKIRKQLVGRIKD